MMDNLKNGDRLLIKIPENIIPNTIIRGINIPENLISDIKRSSVNIFKNYYNFERGIFTITGDSKKDQHYSWLVPVEWCFKYNNKEEKINEIKLIKI